jgi:protein phosphatase
MSDEHPTFAIRYAVRSDRGLVRESNQDQGYAGSRLLAVADGFGPQPGTDLVSAVAIDALRPLDSPDAARAHSVLDVLQDAVRDAGAAVREFVSSDPARHGGGTTLTAMLWSGSRLALVHVGDSRVYLLRDGELFQLTDDHTVVQSMVDDGRLTADEAASHPQRSVLIRALHDGAQAPADVQLRDVRAGDRYLLCSDGLHAVVAAETLTAVLGTVSDPDAAAGRLVDLANEAGGPDNVTCVVADISDIGDE